MISRARRHAALVGARTLLATLALISCDGGDGPTGGGAKPAVVQPYSGSNQEGTVGAEAKNPLVVQVLDASGRGVRGQQVAWSVVQGVATVSPATSTTDSAGQARTTLKFGTSAGPVLVTATVGLLPPAPFIATALPGTGTGTETPVRKLVVLSGDGQTGTVNATLASALVVRVLDGADAPVSGATVTFTPSTGGQLTPTSATTNANGEASTSWRLATTAGQQTVSVSSAYATTATMKATAAAGPAAKLAIASGNEQTGTTGQKLPAPVVVRVSDAWDNVVAGATVTFAVTTGGGTIAPTSVATAADGRASAEWTVGTALGANTATATVAGVGSVTLGATGTPPIHGLSFRVVDAEYNAATGKIVAVSANPSRLHVVDPVTKEIQSVDLAQVPTSVAVQPDGQYAAVGHDAWISYVNLATRAVTKVYAVTADVIDIVLPGNGYVYAFPRVDQWVQIHTIALASGTETKGGSIRAGTLVRLHPSGKYIYGANNGLSPSDFEKYDIRSGTAAVMYDSPYHGDYAFNGNVWVSEDGLRLFARSGNAFRSSEVKAEDMVYAGKLSGMSVVEWVTQSTAAARVYALPGAGWDGPAASELRVYGSDYLAFRGATPLPSFVVPTVGAFASRGRFVFSSTDGTKVYVLVQADGASGLSQDWGWVVYPAAELP